MLFPLVEMVHRILAQAVSPGDTALDATAGRGRDTLCLAQLVGEQGRVYAFDIQRQALDEAAGHLKAAGLFQQVELIEAGHEKVKDYIQEPLAAAVFNLGYLPGGDKTLITQAETTWQGIKGALDLLSKSGLLLAVAYIGHPGGAEEYLLLKRELAALPAHEYQTACLEMLNKEQAPVLFIVEKIGA